MKKQILTLLYIIVLVYSCKTTVNLDAKNSTKKYIPKREHSVQALLWQQQAAEYKALSHQAFNFAKMRLTTIIKQKNTFSKPLAIVTDIDETVLDNSPYNARMVINDENYTKETWFTWGKEAKAKAVPGALAFFNYAKKNNIEVFYISNRDHLQQKETVENLKKIGFPNANDKYVFLKTTTSGKEIRRNKIQKTHEIVMLLGDNLSDFSEVFDKQNTKNRNNLVEDLKNYFGNKYIVLPNPMYGDWETKGIYESNYKWTNKQKDSIRKAKLILK